MRRTFLSLFAFLLSFPAAASVTGVVINADGQPVAGAKVSLCAPETIEARRVRLMSKTPERTALAAVTTDSKGAFRFDVPKDRAVVDVQIEASGFAPDTIRLLADDDAGAIALVAAPMRQGTITAGGKPVAGTTVVWIGSSADSVSTTDAQGHYSAPDPSKWANRLAIAHPDYAILQEVVRGGEVKSLDRTLSPGVAISGHVVAADGKTPVAKATLVVDDLPLATSADDGSFTIAHAPADWQEVEARSGELAGMRARTMGALAAIRLAKLATLTGSVIDAKTRLPLVSAEVRLGPETPFGGRMRGFGRGAAQAEINSTLTDAKGSFTIAVPPGRYQLMAIYPNSFVGNAPVSLVAGQSLNKTLYGAARGRVIGTVVDDQNHVVPGTRVDARSANRGGNPMMMVMQGRFGMQMSAAGVSGPDGRFVLHNVATDSDVLIDAAKKGLPPAESAKLHLNPGETKTGVMVTIARGVALTGKVTDANGRPLSGVAVEPAEAAAGGFGGIRRFVRIATNARADDNLVRTGSDGAFSLRLKEGTYNVVFTREGFAAKTMRAVKVAASTPPLLVRLDPGVEITGRVTRGGTGIEGVNVTATNMESFANTVTASDGSFTLSDLTPGQMMLNASKPDALIMQIRSVSAPTHDLIIDVPTGGRITGRVVDQSSNQPVTSFQAGISAARDAGPMRVVLPPMQKQFTSDDGTFTLENVPPGPTELVVSAPGYTTRHIPGLNVEDGKTLSDVEVDLGTGAKLTGRVTATDGTPLAGARVALDTGSTGRSFRVGPSDTSTTTDPNGEYTLDSIDPGQQTFVFTHDGYLSESRTINVSGKDGRLDVQLSSGIPLTGMVVTDAGVPVAEANVFATSASAAGFSRQAQTDSGGNFQIAGVAPGHYTITASKQGMAEGILRDFDASTGAPARVVMISGGTISGHVTGLTDAELQLATVMAGSPNGSAQAAVDSTGAYQITGAPTGTVRVSARTGGGFGGGKSSMAQTVQVDPGSSVQVDLQFKSTVVSGHVTQNGQPVSNATISFMPRGGGAQTSSQGTTDANGQYSVNGLDDGTYAVAVIDINHSSAFSGSYTVSGSGTYDIDIKTVDVTGTVTDASTGEPVSDAQVQIMPAGASNTPMMSVRTTQTDPSGAFTIQNVQSGSYEATAQKNGYGHDIRNFVVSDTPPDALQFKIAPSDGVTLNVVDARDNRPLAANVLRVTDMQGNTIDIGGFRFGGGTPEPVKLTLAPGQYSVTLMANGYAPQVVTVNSPSTQTVAMSPGGTLILRSKSSAQQNVRLIMPNGSFYPRGPNGVFILNPSPLTTTLENVAAGQYTLQVLDSGGAVTNTIQITVVDGQQNFVDV